MGMSGGALRGTYLTLYGGTVLVGLLLGMRPAWGIAETLARAMVSSTGMLITLSFSAGVILPILLGLLLLFAAFLFVRTGRILRIAPVQTLREASDGKRIVSGFRKRYLVWDIALRELRAGKRKYIALCVISAFLALFCPSSDGWGRGWAPTGKG